MTKLKGILVMITDYECDECKKHIIKTPGFALLIDGKPYCEECSHKGIYDTKKYEIERTKYE